MASVCSFPTYPEAPKKSSVLDSEFDQRVCLRQRRNLSPPSLGGPPEIFRSAKVVWIDPLFSQGALGHVVQLLSSRERSPVNLCNDAVRRQPGQVRRRYGLGVRSCRQVSPFSTS